MMVDVGRCRENNPNWKGGRIVDPRGYVLIRVGVGHPLADVRGYAYEHRLLAASRNGGTLPPGIEVHHDDEAKGNNDPKNLIECTRRVHRMHHRKATSKLRMPDDPNHQIQCGCGCGSTFSKYDTAGRPRSYAPGHNPHESSTQDACVSAVRAGQATVAEIVTATHTSRNATIVALSKLVRTGKLVRIWRGTYGLPGSAPMRKQELIECACGCGTRIEKYDAYRRERSFVSGHNARVHT